MPRSCRALPTERPVYLVRRHRLSSIARGSACHVTMLTCCAPVPIQYTPTYGKAFVVRTCHIKEQNMHHDLIKCCKKQRTLGSQLQLSINIDPLPDWMNRRCA